MQINGRWQYEDALSGLRLIVIEGQHMNRLHIEFIGKPEVSNRDFWFNADGSFDGTGSGMMGCGGENEPIV